MFVTPRQEEEQELSSSNTLIDLSAFEKYLSLKRVLIVAGLILFLAAWNRGIALLYAMDALIVATLLVGWILPKFNIHNIDIGISLPETANEGEDIPIQVMTRKSGFFSRYMIELWGDFPFASPFALSEKQSGMKLLSRIGNKTTHTMHIPCELRGYYTLDSFTLKTGFPLGISTAEREVFLNQSSDGTHNKNNSEKTSSSILIYPKPLEIKYLKIANDPSHSAMQQDNNPKVGGTDDYIGVREYRHGDNPRHIHWPTSAKRGQHIVREFQQNSTTHLSIILDLNRESNAGIGKHSTLEYTIKITASLVKYAIDNQYSFTVFGLAEKPIEISVNNRSQSTDALENTLEALAWIKADGKISYSHVLRQHLAQSRRGGTIVLFDCNSRVTELLPELYAKHYFPLIYHFDADSFSSRNPLPSYPRKTENNNLVSWQVSSGCDLEGLFV